MSTQNRKPQYQPWSEEEFRADIDVQAMNCFERWMYRALCQAAFFCTTRPDLPDDDSQLWKLAGCENQKQWDGHKASVRAMFTGEKVDGVPVLHRKRLRQDWKRIADKRALLAELGRQGGRRRHANRNEREKRQGEESDAEAGGLANAKQTLDESQALGKQTPSKWSSKSIHSKRRKEEKGRGRTGEPEPSPASAFSPDVTVTLDRPHDGREDIGERFGPISDAGESLDAVVEAVSNGCFETERLATYEHRNELQECCRAAIRELADKPFVSGRSHARIMGRAMELLRKLHKVDAPPGWLPVMKDLRGTRKDPENGSLGTDKATPPEKILTGPWSALHWYAGELRQLEPVLVETAKARGVPGNWVEAVAFLDAATEKVVGEQAVALRKVRGEIRGRIPAPRDAATGRSLRTCPQGGRKETA